MNDQAKSKSIREKSRKDAEKLFKGKPEEARKELEKTFSLGNPENLVKPDNKNE